jgi:hypothetical protein
MAAPASAATPARHVLASAETGLTFSAPAKPPAAVTPGKYITRIPFSESSAATKFSQSPTPLTRHNMGPGMSLPQENIAIPFTFFSFPK